MNKNKTAKKLTLFVLSSIVLVQALLFTTVVSAQGVISEGGIYVPDTGVQQTGDASSGSGADTTDSSKPILETIAGDKKDCPYVKEGLYKPFSNIDTNYAIFRAFNTATSTKAGCIKVQGGMNAFLLLVFKVFIGFCSVLAVIYIAVAGISMMVEQANIQKKIKAKDMLMRALQGLLLSLVAWILLFTINNRLLEFDTDKVFQSTGFQQTIAKGLSSTGNFSLIKASEATTNYLEIPVNNTNTGTGGAGTYPGSGVLAPGLSAGPNPYAGQELPIGATKVSQATIFGYRDGDGRTGSTGDNGVGGIGVSHMANARTNYTGDTRSVGVAVPESWLLRDFGGVTAAKNSAYAIFDNGVHKGNFPIVDVSASKLDFTYGMVIANFDPNPRRVGNDWGWSGYNISYKPLPGYWLNHQRPANPMIQYIRIMGTAKSGYGLHLVSDVLPADTIKAIQEGAINVIMN